MKWTDEEIEKCISLIKEFKRVKPVALVLGRTEKAVNLKMNALKINVRGLYFPLQKKICLNCDEEIKRASDFSVRKFCNKSCHASFYNKKRVLSKETKDKIRKKLKGGNNPNWKGGVSENNYIKKILGKGKCGGCGNYSVEIKNKSICEDCRVEYYKFYRPSCEFDFDIKDYKDFFDLSIINKYGWYKPKNRGDNLGGVSKDHLYSVKDGFINKIPIWIIKHPANCRLILQSENAKKRTKSCITIEELINMIDEFDNKYHNENKKNNG